MPLPAFKIAIPRRFWPAVAIGAGAASVSVVAYGGAIGFIILAAVIIGIGGAVIAPSRWGLRCHRTAGRSAWAVAGAGGIIAAVAGSAALLITAVYIDQRQEYIPTAGNHYEIVNVARLFTGDTTFLANVAGVIVAVIAGSIAVVAAQRLNCAAPSFAGRRRVGIFFTVAVFVIASIAAASLTAIILAQLRAGDAAAAEYYNSRHYISQAPIRGSAISVNYANLAFLIFPVIGLGAMLFFAMCGGAITSGILNGTFAIRRNIPGYELDPTDRIAFLVGAAIFLAAIPAAIILWYGGANGPYPYFGEPPTARAVALWGAAIAANLLSIAVAPVLLAVAVVKLAAKAIAPEAGAPPASR